jgi:hypothetical protein
MGRTTNPRRTPQDWGPMSANDRYKVYGEGQATAVTSWKTFLRNHADGIASMDLFVVPTISFRLLYGLLILHHRRREILWLGAIALPSVEWIARKLTEACAWESAPQYTSFAIGMAFMAMSSVKTNLIVRKLKRSVGSTYQKAMIGVTLGAGRRKKRR